MYAFFANMWAGEMQFDGCGWVYSGFIVGSIFNEIITLKIRIHLELHAHTELGSFQLSTSSYLQLY